MEHLNLLRTLDRLRVFYANMDDKPMFEFLDLKVDQFREIFRQFGSLRFTKKSPGDGSKDRVAMVRLPIEDFARAIEFFRGFGHPIGDVLWRDLKRLEPHARLYTTHPKDRPEKRHYVPRSAA